jgi:DNA sulfur modification protein DndD
VRINRVVLENYGLYSGRNEIDLIPRNKGQSARPIILIGGMNGAGKTTLLDGVRLALYGKTAVGDRLSDKSYQEHLRGLVHRSRNSLIQFNYARVGVEFDFVFHGKRDTYYVQRCWTLRNGNGVQESLQVYKRDDTSQDGDYNSWPTLADLEPEHWQAFVSDIVPERLSQLFFFDGEKIRRIADDISGDTAIAESVRSLLGLDTVVRLKADLAILTTREAKQHMASDDAGALARVEVEIEAIQASLDALSQSRAELETSIRGVEGEIKRLETQLQEQGGVFARDRPEKQSRQAVLESEIQNVQRQIRQECEGLYPLALCPTIACRLEAQIESEARLCRNILLREDVETLKAQLIHNLSSSCNLKVKPVRQEVIRIVQDTFAHHMEGPTACAGCDLLGLSEVDAGRVLDWLREAREGAAETMRRLCSEIEAKEREAQEIRRQLDKAPEQMVLASVFGDLSIQNKLLGQRQAELKSLDEKATTLKNELAAREREKRRLEEKGRERAHIEDRMDMVGNAQKALDNYLARLTQMKVEALCRTVTECFNRLSRKDDLLHDISINPSTFEVHLHDKLGRTIPREELSAGEKQILAIAILWGLAKTSGRPLPVIIDTPLGRLDSDHRMNLVQNYFPHAGHQVILLSTDTEVDKRLFVELRPHISHCHHLVYDKQERRTYPKQEYFWKEQADA